MLDDDKALVPAGLRHERFVIVPLTATTAALDYASYMASPDVIRVHSDDRWPAAGFTFSDDLELVAKHEDDHKSRRAFTFVLPTPFVSFRESGPPVLRSTAWVCGRSVSPCPGTSGRTSGIDDRPRPVPGSVPPDQ